MMPPGMNAVALAENRKLLDVRHLVKYFGQRSGAGPIKAVDDISFVIRRGETLGLVGESGCGKSTAGRSILQLHKPTSGQVLFDGVDLTALPEGQMRKIRRHLQMIFQDPLASLNPKMTVGQIVAEPLIIHGIVPRSARAFRVGELLNLVGLRPSAVDRHAYEFSGGQRQRIGIARALAASPDLIVCDEPVSALDVSIQAQIVNLLEDLQATLGVAYLFIAHDLSVVRHISNRVAVMYLGRIVEIGDRDDLFETPLHPYTKALMSAVPIPDPVAERGRERVILKGDIPSPVNLPSGCRFRTRCPYVMEICHRVDPQLADQGHNHAVACHLYPGQNAGAEAQATSLHESHGRN